MLPDSLEMFVLYGLPHENQSDFETRLHGLLIADKRKALRGKKGIDTATEAEGEVIPVRDYAMPLTYAERLKDWPAYTAVGIFDDEVTPYGVLIRARCPSDPNKGINVGHAIRVLAAFYRAHKEVYEPLGFDDACDAIPVPPLASLSINSRPVADIDECNRILVETVRYDPEATPKGPKYLNEITAGISEQIRWENMRREADEENERFDYEQYREALAENYRLDRIATRSAA